MPIITDEKFECLDCKRDLTESTDWEPFVAFTGEHVRVCYACLEEIALADNMAILMATLYAMRNSCNLFIETEVNLESETI